MIPPKYSELAKLFGPIIMNRDPQWEEERAHMVYVPVPTQLQMYLLWRNPGSVNSHPVQRIYANKLMGPHLARALNSIVERKLCSHVKGYGGCFQIRTIRERDAISTHSWGMAIDINPDENPLGVLSTEESMNPALVKCFTDAGFVWGGTFQRPDPQHFQWVTHG